MVMHTKRLALILLVAVWGLGQEVRAEGSVYTYDLKAIEGGPLPLERYAGQPILLVNTASFCGFTYQYEQLQALWDRYRDRGLIVLGVPSNDFGAQEPGSEAEIQEFCEVNFAITFPMSEKEVVIGSHSHPLFDYLRAELGRNAGPSWNFNKYMIDAQGIPQAHWPASVKPDDRAIVDAIEAALPQS